MTRKEYILLGFVVVMTVLYAIFFTDWFRPKIIRIEHSARYLQRGAPGRPASPNVTFSLQDDYKLTSLKVVRVSEYLTNEYAHPLWELVAEDSSEAIDGFAYGAPVPGMAPASPYAETEPLVAGVDYRLIVEAGSAKGEHVFQLRTPESRRP